MVLVRQVLGKHSLWQLLLLAALQWTLIHHVDAAETAADKKPPAPLQPASKPDVAADQSGTGSATPAPAGPVKVDGGSFASTEFPTPQIEGSIQILAHYGRTTATVDLKHDVRKATIHLKPRPVEGSYPIVSLVERLTGGKYARTYVIRDEVLKTGAEIAKDVEMAPGTWRVTVEFFKSSGQGRSHLEVHSITFE